ncbi:hypothetical protein HK102_008493, partial [Quaeritorhiza haematococci]
MLNYKANWVELPVPSSSTTGAEEEEKKEEEKEGVKQDEQGRKHYLFGEYPE